METKFVNDKLMKLNDIISALDDCKTLIAEVSKAESQQAGGDPEGLYNILVQLDELMLEVEDEIEATQIPTPVQAAPQA